MSYANGTTHYGLPQTVGTDKRDWFDTNQAFADVDEALYGAVQQSTSTATALTALTIRVGAVESDVATIQTSQAADEANIAALQTLTSQHTTQIADVKADALDMICAVDEGTAQVASVAVSEGDYFRYNDVLYMATTDIAVGDTIVPNTNCRATNVATELVTVNTAVSTKADASAVVPQNVGISWASTLAITGDVYKSAGIVNLGASFTCTDSLVASTEHVIGAVSDATNYPPVTTYGSAISLGGITGVCYVKADGNICVLLHDPLQIGDTLYVSLTWR